MNKASERYNTKVEIPISVILETIFSDDNEDVETLSRWAKHYGFVDLIEDERGKYYKLQNDYTKQSFYIWLSKEERKQYDYENFLLDKLEVKQEEIERLNNIINELDNLISIKIIREANEEDYHIDINDVVEIKNKLLELKGEDKE